jgi:predicted metal-dependent phosphotriesterase family hydrolase
MAEEMSAAAKDGLGCIVDGGHPDMGRKLDFLRRLSTKSGMPIAASGGYPWSHSIPTRGTVKRRRMEWSGAVARA